MKNSIAMGILGTNVRKLRLAMGLSQVELAERIKVYGSHISKIERGQQNCTVEIVERIAEAGGVPIGKLFDEHFEPADYLAVHAA